MRTRAVAKATVLGILKECALPRVLYTGASREAIALRYGLFAPIRADEAGMGFVGDSDTSASMASEPADDAVGPQPDMRAFDDESKFRALFEMSPIGVAYHKMMYDDSGKPVDYLFLDANQRYQELTGVDPRGKRVTEAFPGIENDAFDWIGTFGRVAQTGEQIRFEQYLESNGRWYDCVAYRYMPDHFVAAFLEITERKRAEAALKESQLLLSFSMESHQDALYFALDGDYRYLFFNKTHAEAMSFAYGTTPEVGLDILELITSDDDRVQARENYDRALAGESHSNIRVYGDANLAYYESFFNPIIDDRGEVIGATGLARNITQRKQAEDELRETTAYLENLFGYANAPIIVWDSDLVITRFNHAFEELTGRDADEVVGDSLDILFPHDRIEESLAYVTRASAGERWESVEIPIQRSDGTVRTVLWNSATIYAEDGVTPTATIAQGQDITKRKRALQALERSKVELEAKNVELERLNAQKNQFLGMAAHDLRNPVNLVMNYADLLDSDTAPSLVPKHRDYVEIISRTSEGMARLIDSFLDVSLIDAGKFVLTLDPVNVPRLVRASCQAVEATALNRDVSVRSSIGVGLATRLGDESKLEQVLINLLSNAIQASTPGASVTLDCRMEGDDLLFSVTDAGSGIDKESVDRLFRAFDSPQERKSDGSRSIGLGLLIAQKIVAAHGGHMVIVSEPGRGSKFGFTVPPAIPSA